MESTWKDWIPTRSTWPVLLALNVVQVFLSLKGCSLTVATLILLNLSWCLVELLRPRIMEPVKRWLPTCRVSSVARAFIVAVLPEKGVEVSKVSGAEIVSGSQTDSPEPMESRDPEEEALPVTDPNWRWPWFEKWYSEGRFHTERKTSSQKASEKWPFEVMSHTFDKRSNHYVTLHSPHLIEIVKKCLPNNEQIFCKKPRIAAKDIFLARDSLRNYLQSDEDSSQNSASDEPNNEQGRCYLGHLLRFVEEEFKDALLQYERMKQEGSVSWEMLWTFLGPGEEVCRKCQISNQQCYATVGMGDYVEFSRNTKYFWVKLNVMDYNLEGYRKCTLDYEIEEFAGEVPFTSLQVCPMQFFAGAEREDMEATFRRRGEMFYSVAMKQPIRFMQYKGSLNFKFFNASGRWQLKKENADGRVMIDLLSFARMNPEYPLGNAEPPCEVLQGVRSSSNNMVVKKPDEEPLKLAPAIVYGFSFRLKQWGCFDVCGVRDISFNELAFDQLAMTNEKEKEMLLSVVAQYVSDEQPPPPDLISNKGEGCIIMCYGPPGTGKTLTAESIAEKLHRPLWSMSAFELGKEAGELETKLRQTLDIARAWKAVLLLDEADAYLEKRGTDVARNLMTGVFLRVLEYYSGVLFLTTNRAQAFDPAFLSRISLTIRYPPLHHSQRLKIWQSLLQRAGLLDVNCDFLLPHQLNGRQIRNIIAMAQTWAQSRKHMLSCKDLGEVMDVVVAGFREFEEDSIVTV